MHAETRYVVCVRNDGYAESLERKKIYTQLADPDAEKRGFIRVVDEDEDYIYPAEWFLPIALPHDLEQALANLA